MSEILAHVTLEATFEQLSYASDLSRAWSPLVKGHAMQTMLVRPSWVRRLPIMDDGALIRLEAVAYVEVDYRKNKAVEPPGEKACGFSEIEIETVLERPVDPRFVGHVGNECIPLGDCVDAKRVMLPFFRMDPLKPGLRVDLDTLTRCENGRFNARVVEHATRRENAFLIDLGISPATLEYKGVLGMAVQTQSTVLVLRYVDLMGETKIAFGRSR